MCNAANCTATKLYNGSLFCYRHRGQIKATPVVEEKPIDIKEVEETYSSNTSTVESDDDIETPVETPVVAEVETPVVAEINTKFVNPSVFNTTCVVAVTDRLLKKAGVSKEAKDYAVADHVDLVLGCPWDTIRCYRFELDVNVRRFVWVSSKFPDLVAQFLDTCSAHKMNYHEVFLSGRRGYRFFLDLDIKIPADSVDRSLFDDSPWDSPIEDQKATKFMEYTEQYVNGAYNALSTYLDSSLCTDIKLSYDTRNRETDDNCVKYSIHAFTNLILPSMESCKIVATKMIELAKETIRYNDEYEIDEVDFARVLIDSLDTAPYHNNGSLAMTGSYKNSNVLKRVSEIDHVNHEVCYYHMKTNGQYEMALNHLETKTDVPAQDFSGCDDFLKAVADKAASLPWSSAYDVKPIVNARGFMEVCRKDVQSYDCCICDRVHASAGANWLKIMVFKDTKTAIYGCRRSNEKMRVFYKATKSAYVGSGNDDKKDHPGPLDFLKREAAADISELTGISLKTVSVALSDDTLRPSKWAEKYVESLQINSPFKLTERSFILFKKYVRELYFESLEIMAKYMALHINRYVILLDGKYWIREDPTSDGIVSSREPLESIVVNYNAGLTDDKPSYKTKKLDKLFVYILQYFHIYNQVVTSFEPVDDISKFNMSNPYAANLIENPDYSKIEFYLTFLREVICAESDELFQHYLQWKAHICQYPNDKTKVAIVLISPKEGTGKTVEMDITAAIVGEANRVACAGSLKPITGDRTAHLIGKKLITCNEVAEKKIDYSSTIETLKSVITDRKMSCRPLYQEAITVDNYLELMISSNNRNIISLNEQTRRFTAINVSDHHKDDRVYFAPLHAAIHDQEFINTLYTYLMKEIKVERGSLRAFKTKALKQMAAVSANSISKYMSNLMNGPEEEFKEVFGTRGEDDDEYQPLRLVPVKDEYSVDLSDIYRSFKSWCTTTEQHKLSSEYVFNYIKDGHIQGVVARKVKGHRVIRVHVDALNLDQDD
jgi:hypothetical protein